MNVCKKKGKKKTNPGGGGGWNRGGKQHLVGAYSIWNVLERRKYCVDGGVGTFAISGKSGRPKRQTNFILEMLSSSRSESNAKEKNWPGARGGDEVGVRTPDGLVWTNAGGEGWDDNINGEKNGGSASRRGGWNRGVYRKGKRRNDSRLRKRIEI